MNNYSVGEQCLLKQSCDKQFKAANLHYIGEHLVVFNYLGQPEQCASKEWLQIKPFDEVVELVNGAIYQFDYKRGDDENSGLTGICSIKGQIYGNDVISFIIPISNCKYKLADCLNVKAL
jgi:hypothetical protein